MDDKRIAALEARIAKLEARLAEVERGRFYVLPSPPVYVPAPAVAPWPRMPEIWCGPNTADHIGASA